MPAHRKAETAAARQEQPRAEAHPPSKPTVMLIVDLLASTWNLARTLAAAPLRLLQAARERPA